MVIILKINIWNISLKYMQFHRKFSEAVSFYNQKPLKKFECNFFVKSDKFFDYHLECGIDIAFIWDIPELYIR